MKRQMKRRAHYQQRRAEADGYTIVNKNGEQIHDIIWSRWAEGGLHIKPESHSRSSDLPPPPIKRI